MNAWLDIADKSQGAIISVLDAVDKDGSPQPKGSPQLSIQAGIATQRAKELAEMLDKTRDLPSILPEDDEAARQAVKQAWYSAARHGSPTASRHLALALGMRAAATQPVVVTFERPSDEEDIPPSAPKAPATDPRLH